jgi:hypothetical protein
MVFAVGWMWVLCSLHLEYISVLELFYTYLPDGSVSGWVGGPEMSCHLARSKF